MRPDLANRAGSPPSVRELLDEAIAVEHRDAAASRELVQRARVLAHGQNDRPGEAEAFYRLATLTYYTGNTDEAFEVAVDAHDLATRCGAVLVAAWALNLMGILHFQAGNHSEALSCCLRSLEQYRTTDHGDDEGSLLNTIATIHQAIGDTDRAIVTFGAALAVHRELGRPDLDAITLAHMARLHCDRQEYFLAVSFGESALEQAREHAVEQMPDVLINLGAAYSGVRDSKRSAECLLQALRLLDERAANGAPGSPSSMISLRIALGQAAMAERDLIRAEAELGMALQLARDTKNRKAELTVHELLTTLYRRAGDFEKALNHRECQFDLHKGLFDKGSDLRIKALLIAHDSAQDRELLEAARARSAKLEADLAAATRRLAEYEIEVSRQVGLLADDRDPGAGAHAVRVGDLAYRLADAMGDNEQDCADLRLAARLHDFGRMSAPDAILFKTGPLTADEMKVLKWHTERWAQVLADSASPRAQLGAVVARHHHERWDGSGYPAGLHGGDIPRAARIVSVADVFDALTHDNRDQPAWSTRDASAYIVGGSGTLFDPQVVDAFVRVIGPPELA